MIQQMFHPRLQNNRGYKHKIGSDSNNRLMIDVCEYLFQPFA